METSAESTPNSDVFETVYGVVERACQSDDAKSKTGWFHGERQRKEADDDTRARIAKRKASCTKESGKARVFVTAQAEG